MGYAFAKTGSGLASQAYKSCLDPLTPRLRLGPQATVLSLGRGAMRMIIGPRPQDESGISLRDVLRWALLQRGVLQQDVFDRLHAAPLRFVLVVVAEKMDTAVGEQQAADLLFEGCR